MALLLEPPVFLKTPLSQRFISQINLKLNVFVFTPRTHGHARARTHTHLLRAQVVPLTIDDYSSTECHAPYVDTGNVDTRDTRSNVLGV